MRDVSTHMNDIPTFMRRPAERAPAKLEFPDRPRAGAPGAARAAPLPRPESAIHGGLPPVQPDFLIPVARPAAAPGRARLPWLARRKTPAPKNPESPDAGAVVDLTAHRGAAPGAEGQTGEAGAAGDAAFQVTLPRGVIRQIRMRAAEGSTTHRAIVLRALRTAGLEIPEGADVDRRATAARRRQQA